MKNLLVKKNKKIIPAIFLFMFLSIVGLYFINEIINKKKQDIVLSYILGSVESGKLTLVETLGLWTGIYTIEGKFLILRSDWEVRYQIGYSIDWFLDLQNDGFPFVSIDKKGNVKIRIQQLKTTGPKIKPETFVIMNENRSFFINEEEARIILFNSVENEVCNVIENITDMEEVNNIAIESLKKITIKACKKNKIKVKNVSVKFI